jgi:hypothetical protein
MIHICTFIAISAQHAADMRRMCLYEITYHVHNVAFLTLPQGSMM